MRLFTFQPPSVVQTLKDGKTFICDPSLATFLQEDDQYNDGFRQAYDWLVAKMNEKIQKPENVQYPVWAWYLINGKNVKPDRRTSLFKNYNEYDTIMELDIPEDSVLLTDFDDWHYVISNYPYQSDEEYEANPDWEPTEEEKIASWDVVFDVAQKDHVQACVWKIEPENIVKFHQLRKR